MSLPPGIEDVCELTPLQQGMLFHSLYTPEASVYLIQLVLTLEGELDAEALQRAWTLLVERHAPLRTAFVWERVERPFQVVHRQAELPLVRVDWRALDADGQARALDEFLEADRRRGFDLTRPPLMRLALADLADGKCQFIWTFHHILIEGWSSSILLAELWHLYGKLTAGGRPELPPAPSYLSYLRWLKGQDQGAAERYWRAQLRGFSNPTRLPVDRLTGDLPAEVRRVEECALDLSLPTYEALRRYAREQRLTLNTVAQGLWAILLARYTGEEDVVFGMVVSGRPAELTGADAMVGLFVNTLPARVRVPPAQPVADWLRALQLDQAAMRQYEYSSLMQVRSWSEVSGGQPLFHCVFAFENWLNAPAPPIAGGAVRVVRRKVHEESDQPLTCFVTFDKTLRLTLMYDVERFSRPAMERMLEHYRCLVDGLVSLPAARIDDLPILPAAERRQLLVEWNATRTDYPREASIKALFEAQAAATPAAVALEWDAGTLTYAELNRRANRVAHTLIGHGVGPEVTVGLLVGRSPEMVIGLLGILKAGGAYLPLDPDYPASRLALMLEDAAPPVVLVTAGDRARLPPSDARVVSLDEDQPAIAAAPDSDPAVAVGAGNLAYVMYTSGSTGRPKGACIEQRGVVRMVKGNCYMGLGAETVFMHYAPISFDASILELWGPLLNGGRVVLCPPGVLSLEELARVIREHRVNAVWLTAALFQQLVNERVDCLRAVRYLLTGGDVVSVAHARRVLEEIEGLTLINAYGPTENTSFTTCQRVDPDLDPGRSLPIGRPIANTTVYVLDAALRPLPIGIVGELYTGGDGVARGYLARPELTAERFLPDPFADQAGARMYRTGDLVRYLEDGAIEFLGRADQQVKLRGFRIELGEIDAVLGQHPQVRDVLTVLREDQAGDKRLVAYVVAAGEEPPTPDALRVHLRRSLPDYMVPAAFVYLAALPMTANGKLDRRALPAPDGARQVGIAFAAPQSDAERQVAAVWQDVLRVREVGLDDNFFDLGGNSLLLVRVHGKLKATLRDDLTIVDLFRFPTIRALVRHLGVGGEATVPNYDALRERARRRRERRPQGNRVTT